MMHSLFLFLSFFLTQPSVTFVSWRKNYISVFWISLISISYYVLQVAIPAWYAVYFQANDIALPGRRNKSAILGAAWNIGLDDAAIYGL